MKFKWHDLHDKSLYPNENFLVQVCSGTLGLFVTNINFDDSGITWYMICVQTEIQNTSQKKWLRKR